MWQIIEKIKPSGKKANKLFAKTERKIVWMCEKINMFVDEARPALPCKSSTTEKYTQFNI